MIGLFGLLGMAGVSTGPFSGRIIDKLVPWYVSLIGVCAMLVFQAILVAAGGIHVAAVIVYTFGLDVFRQSLQVSLSTAVFRCVIFSGILEKFPDSCSASSPRRDHD